MGVRKGCYNCSKRRILCDETEPQCLKCVKKGLECSGQGLRIRFNNGVASRVSNTIAPGMVILDSQHNGYRNFILPLARHDPLVQKAVTSVAGFHLWRNSPELRSASDIGRAQVINQMKQASLASDAEQVMSASIWATLLVLLVGELILGGDHYVYLLRMMYSLQASGLRDRNSDLLRFLHRQTDLLMLLAQPFVDNLSGILLHDPASSFENLRLEESLADETDEECQHIIDIVLQATRVCFKIYSDCLIKGRPSSASTLEYVKDLVFDLQPSYYGGHSLVWVYFVAAADSEVDDHRAFFTNRLVDIYNATGSENISKGLKMLEQLWARAPVEPWPQILPSISTTFVM